ncbi:MAG: hypothetical protein ACREHC_01070 [Candidatus Levyibacteriota bacterium]
MKIKKTAFSVGLWSEDYEGLAKWYQKVIKLQPALTSNLQEDSFIAEPFLDPLGGDNWCMTFKDPEENILQMYGKK